MHFQLVSQFIGNGHVQAAVTTPKHLTKIIDGEFQLKPDIIDVAFQLILKYFFDPAVNLGSLELEVVDKGFQRRDNFLISFNFKETEDDER